MPFVKGQSGNPAGRPKSDPLTKPDRYSVKEALERVVRTRPDLLEDAIERLLRGSRSALGMLELAAKLNRELQQDNQAAQIAIVFTGGLDPNKLKATDGKVVHELPAGISGEAQGSSILQQVLLVPKEQNAETPLFSHSVPIEESYDPGATEA